MAILKCPLCEQKRIVAEKTIKILKSKKEKLNIINICRKCSAVIKRLNTVHETANQRHIFICPKCKKETLLSLSSYAYLKNKKKTCVECEAKKLMGKNWKKKIAAIGASVLNAKPVKQQYRFFGCELTRQPKIGEKSERCELNDNCIFFNFCLAVTSAENWDGFTATGKGHPIQYDQHGKRLSRRIPVFKVRIFKK
jgi:hypothetical protein